MTPNEDGKLLQFLYLTISLITAEVTVATTSSLTSLASTPGGLGRPLHQFSQRNIRSMFNQCDDNVPLANSFFS